jgi:hypothetical protein
LWVIFALLDPDPDPYSNYGSGSGSNSPIEYGSGSGSETLNNSKKNIDSYCFVTSLFFYL